jgi:hypothetical protein
MVWGLIKNSRRREKSALAQLKKEKDGKGGVKRGAN